MTFCLDHQDERGQSLLHIITARGMFDVVENDLTAAAVNAKVSCACGRSP